MEVVDGVKTMKVRTKCLKGKLVTLNAILQIWDHIKTEHHFKFLLIRRSNTDLLENFFGAIRQQGGNSDNPTAVQFTQAFSKLFFNSFLQSLAAYCDQDLIHFLHSFVRWMKCQFLSNKEPNQIHWTLEQLYNEKVSTNIEDNAVC